MKTLTDKATWASVARGAAMAASGAAATYVIAYFGNLDWGTWAPSTAALLAVATNILRKFGLGD